ncbi:polysaccharide deacetylase family protein [Dactylosporangium fulvum]|uniref:Polysaccharide deacetylase family protein n=1 Tax=Dactylosporangium fulvum TaxID=53359 RepID=A0ABY5W5L2_9ACTN|nr:polysaccharide deacetylase family protein [Dactylosporangium fulvum]UWP84665.1 polysaccharide deacetylase family protein [Dactylosporangium fulvum]
MSKRSPLRLVATAVLAGAIAATAHALPGSAAPGARDHRWAGTTGEYATASQSSVPAPPRPAKLVPSERVVTTGQLKLRAADSWGSLLSSLRTVLTGLAAAKPATTTTAATKTSTGAGAPGSNPSTKTLVLYDSTGPYGWLGEDYGMMATNLVSHFGAWTAHPVGGYTAGELAKYSAVVYVGSTYDEPIPAAFLDDVLATSKPVVWMYDNIWQLTARSADFATKYGYTWKGFDVSSVARVNYKGTALTRDARNAGGIMDYAISDATKAVSVGEAVRADGTKFPWGVKSGNLTYLGEIPFSYITSNDRYLAFSDLLFDALAPQTAARHRALVRIEDVGPDADPAELRAIADYLSSRKVPFTVAVYSRYRDPKGVNNNGKAEDYTLRQRPLVVSALKYMQSKGGTLLMHGYTHQLDALNNPYDGVSANDFEFFRAHVDANDAVIYDGPVKNDSAANVTARVTAARAEFLMAGLNQPTIFEPPHYAASALDYKTINSLFGVRYDRGLYFPGVLSGGTVDNSVAHMVGQFFPYTVRDVYGSTVIPENIGNIEPEPFNQHPAVLPADLVANAKANLAVRDGVASFFYHPFLGTSYLKQTVEGIQGLGYTFVAASAMS